MSAGDSGRDEAAVAKPASTVLFIRDGQAGIEVYLIRRVKGMPFAGGMTAYPGGGVDPRDRDAEFQWVGPEPAAWAEAFGCEITLAKALVAAAVRETFEEAGVLLATEPDGAVFDVDNDEWEAERLALIAREKSLAELLAERGLVLRADLIRPWAHWITPADEPRRFDTYFFVTTMPDGIQPREIIGEYDKAEWVPVVDAIAQGESGERIMLPPTIVTMQHLAGFASVDAAMAGAPTTDIETIEPLMVKRDDVWFAQLPDGQLMRTPLRI